MQETDNTSKHKHLLSILVENHAGVLSRISGLFSRRGYNIDSLSVGPTADPKYSRITIVTTGDDMIIEQICKQVKKLIDVIEILELMPNASVSRELVFVKIKCLSSQFNDIAGIVEVFRARIIDISPESITVEITGTGDKIEAFTLLMEPFGIKEISRTGVTAMQRGVNTII